MEEYSVDDPTQLLEAASDYAYYPGFFFFIILTFLSIFFNFLIF